MLHRLVAMRGLMAMGLAAAVGAWGLHAHPVDMTDPFLGLIEARSPGVFVALVYGYAALWFTHAVLRGLTRALAARDRGVTPRSARAYPTAAAVPAAGASARADAGAGRNAFRDARRAVRRRPGWLTIPQRGLYTGVMVRGRGGHRQDVGVHVSVRRPIAPLARGRSRPARSAAWCWK